LERAGAAAAALASYDPPTRGEATADAATIVSAVSAASATVIAAAAGLQARRASAEFTALGGSVLALSIPEDSAGTFTFTLTDPTEAVVDLTGLLLQFVMVDAGGERTILGNGAGESGLAIREPPTAGVVDVTLSSTETATAGPGRYELWDVTNQYLYALGTLTVRATEGPEL
jgi:hypothetical protein